MFLIPPPATWLEACMAERRPLAKPREEVDPPAYEFLGWAALVAWFCWSWERFVFILLWVPRALVDFIPKPT